MDIGFLNSIRLAERRGLLRDRLSRVQSYGLQLLIMQDQRESREAQYERIRLALVTAHPELMRGAFPEFFEAEEIVTEEMPADPQQVNLNRENTSYQFTEVAWQRPGELVDEDLMLLNRMLGNTGVTVQGMPGAPEEVNGDLGFDIEPDDAEWT